MQNPPKIPHLHEHIYKKLDYFHQAQKIPNLIFHGSSGTGKRTIVYDFLNTIYGSDKQKLKANVMMVNCAHGKGIKFIRDDLKFFAKTNIQSNSNVAFKSIVLLNADSLTIDAQSALRRCIELFSHNTRFFIIVENKHKLLNPILSRFCEIYVPEYIVDGQIYNLHKRQNDFGNVNHLEKMEWLFPKILHIIENRGEITHTKLADLSLELYERGYSTLDLLNTVTKILAINYTCIDQDFLPNAFLCFQKVKSEFRCEKLLLFYMLDFMFLRSNKELKNISLM